MKYPIIEKVIHEYLYNLLYRVGENGCYASLKGAPEHCTTQWHAAESEGIIGTSKGGLFMIL